MDDRPKTEKPLFVIVAGPNGSGKSTAYEQSFPELGERTVWIVNPDRLTARLIEVVGLDNSGSEPQLIGVKVGDVVELNEAPQVLERALGLH